MKKLDQRGTGIVELILILVIVGIIGFVAWYVWNSRQKTSETLSAASKSSQNNLSTHSTKHTANKIVEGSDGWTTFYSGEGKFSVRYPNSWVQPAYQDLCGDFIYSGLFVGPDIKSVLKCGGDGTYTQVSIDSLKGDKRSDPLYTFNKQYYDVQAPVEISVDGVKGTEEKAVYSAIDSSYGLGSLPKGTIEIHDTFYVNNRTYFVAYMQKPAGSEGPTTDQTELFKEIRDSLKFAQS